MLLLATHCQLNVAVWLNIYIYFFLYSLFLSQMVCRPFIQFNVAAAAVVVLILSLFDSLLSHYSIQSFRRIIFRWIFLASIVICCRTVTVAASIRNRNTSPSSSSVICGSMAVLYKMRMQYELEYHFEWRPRCVRLPVQQINNELNNIIKYQFIMIKWNLLLRFAGVRSSIQEWRWKWVKENIDRQKWRRVLANNLGFFIYFCAPFCPPLLPYFLALVMPLSSIPVLFFTLGPYQIRILSFTVLSVPVCPIRIFVMWLWWCWQRNTRNCWNRGQRGTLHEISLITNALHTYTNVWWIMQ